MFILPESYCAVALPPETPGMDGGVDTVRLTLNDVETHFFRTNLQLLSSKLSVEATRGLIRQASLWNNPNIAFEQNVHNQETGKYFDVTSTGNSGIQIQQLITLAGKRNKQISLAMSNTEIARHGYDDLLRTLRNELRTDFYDLYYLRQSLVFYEESIPNVRRTVEAAEAMYTDRALLLSELLRLKSLLLTLESDQLDIRNQAAALETDLRLMLHDTAAHPATIIPVVDDAALDTIGIRQVDQVRFDSQAVAGRPDYLSALETVRTDETNLELQNALRIPDITVGGLWSRQGSYIPNYYALTLAIDLPIFNRNQGNIEAAEATLEADRTQQEHLRLKIMREIAVAFEKARDADELYRRSDPGFPSQYHSLVEGMLESYQRRNISIIAFTDFYEAYRTSMLQLNRLRSTRMDAIESLNYAVGTIVLNKQS